MLTKPLPGVMDDPFHSLSQGCVCHLLFNEGAGSLAYDVSGHGNHGVLKNMSPNAQDSGWSGSKFGGGLAFNGTDDYVDCGNDASLFPSDAITVTLRVNPGAAQNNFAGIAGKLAGANGWVLRYYNNKPSLRFGNGTAYDDFGATGSTPTGEWTNFALTFDGTYYIFYFNGVAESPISATIGQISNLGTSVLIGSDALVADRYFNGSIDSVQIYNRALSAKEIKQLYHDPFCNLMQVPAWQLYSPAVRFKYSCGDASI
jgi:hypothetical protein